MGPKGEDTRYGSEGGSKNAIMACVESTFDAHPIGEDKISHDEVFGVGDWVNEYGGVVREGVVGDL